MKRIATLALLVAVLAAAPARAFTGNELPGPGPDLRPIGNWIAHLWKGELEVGPITIIFHDRVHIVRTVRLEAHR